MELFAGFVLDGVGVVLETLDVAVEAVVLFFEAHPLLLKLTGFGSFVREGGEAVVAEDDAITDNHGHGRNSDGRDTATPAEEALARGLRHSRYPPRFSRCFLRRQTPGPSPDRCFLSIAERGAIAAAKDAGGTTLAYRKCSAGALSRRAEFRTHLSAGLFDIVWRWFRCA